MQAIARALRSALVGLVLALGLEAPALARAVVFQPASLVAWEIRPPSAGSEKVPDYLVGTAHFPLAKTATLSAEFAAVLAKCDKFYMEADLDSVTPEVVGQYIILPQGESLQKLLPPKAWKKLVAAAKPLGLAAETLQVLEPWYLSMVLTLPEMDAKRMLDSVLREAAQGQRVDVGFLETAHDVLSAMDGVPRKEGVAMLIETLDDLQGQKKQVDDIARAYHAGDLARIQTILFGDGRAGKYPQYYDMLLFNRNRLWLPKIEAAVEDHDAMVAVGLGHLLGKDGLIAALERKGYTVRKVKL
ncbi:MAG: TraB/GumN family protein [Candidatus Sericytochromatia bacterium]|nr:TraB/GumN family protein [Candidatus Tanganyikabacteria bacterium]